MTIFVYALLGGLAAVGPIALVLVHRSGGLTDWWYAHLASARRIRRL